MQKRLLFLISLLLCLTTTMMAQITTSGMSGKVTADGEDVIGATIEVVHVPSGTKYQAEPTPRVCMPSTVCAPVVLTPSR